MFLRTIISFLLLSCVYSEDDTASIEKRTVSQYDDPLQVWAINEPNQQSNTRRISEKKCQEYTRGFVPKDLAPPRCSYGVIARVQRAVGGADVTPGEFPYMAAIGWTADTGDYIFSCGGSLISRNFVLTAGHCRSKATPLSPEPVIVRLGDKNIDKSVHDGANPIEIAIKKIHPHPDYKPPKRYNDIALLELAAVVSIGTSIRPACLWTQPDFGEHTEAVATGWGVTDLGTRASSAELQKVSLSLLENNYCDTLLAPYINRNWEGFSHSQMCAGEVKGGKGTCQGDSGAPLQVLSKENRCIFYVMGVLSFGKGCAEVNKPSIFTRVYSYLDWIESIVWSEEYAVYNASRSRIIKGKIGR